MTPSEIIFHRRVRVLEHAAVTTVAEASRVFGVSRKTIHDWKRLAAGYGLDALMPKAKRAPAMPNATPTWMVEELLVEAVVRPTLGADRYAEILFERGFVMSRSGVQKILNRSGLGRRRQRVAALAQLTAATSGLVTEPALEGRSGSVTSPRCDASG
jgi:transposase